MKWIFLIAIILIWNTSAISQVMAGPDQSICIGETTTLQGTGPANWDYTWTSVPADPSISNPNILTPTIQPTSVAVYVYTLTGTTISTTNLVTNGDFELGNTGFTSDYDYCDVQYCLHSSPPNGEYGINNDPNFLHEDFPSCGDHTTGSGNMMVINGAEISNTTLYETTVNGINSNTNYEFSTWLTSMVYSIPMFGANLQFEINGSVIGTLNAPSTLCQWSQYFEVWNSGSATSATIRIINLTAVSSGLGNDFAIDDVALYEIIEDDDNCTVTVLEIATSTFTLDTEICMNNAADITYTGNTTPGPSTTYNWNFGIDAIIISGTEAGPYSIKWTTPGTKTVSLSVETGCNSDTTYMDIVVNQNPDIGITADATSIPYGTNTILHGDIVGAPGPFQFTWSPTSMLINPLSQDPTTVILESDIYYYFDVIDQTSNCTSLDSILIQITGGAFGIFSLVGTPDTICVSESTNLHVNVLGGSGIYSASWTSNPPGYSNTGLSVDASPISTTIYFVEVSDGFNTLYDTIEITVLQETLITIQPQDKEIIIGGIAQFSVTADFAITYQWQISTDGGVNFTELTNIGEYGGVDSPTLTINPVNISMESNIFRCVVSGNCNNITSSPAILNIVSSPDFIGGLENVDVCVSDTFSIACNISNFLKIIDFNLSIEFDNASISFIEITNIAPEIESATTATISGNTITISWNSSQDVTIADGSLFNLSFSALTESTSSLTWNHDLSNITNKTGQQPTMLLTNGDIIVNPLAFAPVSIMADKDTVNIDDIVNITLSAYGGSGNNLIWSLASCDGDTVGKGTPIEIMRPEHTSTYYAYWLNQCGKSACSEVQVVITFDYIVGIPSAFTPNGDGINDEFKVVSNSTLINFNMQIFSRWGELIFESSDQQLGWKGTYKGSILHTNSYVWKISYNYSNDGSSFQTISKTGSVMLIN